jgi:hypothetical protein
VLVITAIVMATILIAASWAIDTAIWFVHSRHLQTQADAAAFAGADAMAQGMIDGTCTDSTVKSVVGQYDGSQNPVSGQLVPANQQVPSASPSPPTFATTYSPTAHNLFDQINQANFENQSIPGNTGLTGSPCSDAAVDVKMTETNLPSFLTFLKPPYLNKQARVSAQTVASQGSAPFVLPNITTPKDVAVVVVGENAATPAFSTDTILASVGACADNGNTSPCLAASNSQSTWTANSLSVPFGSTPASLVVAQSTSAISPATLSGITTGAQLVTFCGSSGVSCYDGADGVGLTYTRTYSSTTPNFPTQAPVVEDTSVSDAPTDPSQCKSTGTTNLFTGFIASGSQCNVNVSADINFGASETCTALSSTLKAVLTITASSGGSATLNCPNPAGLASGVWTTAQTIAVPINAGPVTFDLTWKRTAGGSTVPKESWEQGGNSTNQCQGGSNACTADFKIVQRIFMGAFDQNSASTSHSGSVAGVAFTSGSGELMYTPANATVSGLGVTVDFQALYDATAGPNGYVPNGSFSDIAYGTNQSNGLADCGQGVNNGKGTNGFDVQQNAIAGLFICTNFPVEPPSFLAAQCTSTVCPNTVPGNKFIQWLDAGLATRIYGCPEASSSPPSKPQNGCSSNPLSVAACRAHPNYWSTQNLLFSVEADAADPRLLSVMITDPGTIKNGNTMVPVRHYAEFYVTGWTGDPCSGVSIGTGPDSTTNLYYTDEDVAPTDAAGDFFLVGHFIHYFDPNATGSGNKCVLDSIDNCVLTLSQ